MGPGSARRALRDDPWRETNKPSAGLARRHIGVPPGADIAGEGVVALHYVDRDAAACFRHFVTEVTRLIATFRGKPGTIMPPQAGTFGALMRRPSVGVDAA